MYHPFSIAEAIKTAWDVLKKNFITLVVYSILSLFIYGVIDFLTVFILFDNSIVSQLIVIFLQMLIQSYLALSFYKLILTLMDKAYYEFEFKEIVPSVKMAFRFISVGLIYTLLIALFIFINLLLRDNDLGLEIAKLVEVLTVIYLLIRSIFCVCFIVDDDSQSIESLQQSFGITKDNFFKTLSIVLIIIAFMIVMLIPIVAIISLLQPDAEEDSYVFKLAFYIWFVLTFPTVQVLVMVTYRKLVYAHQDIDDDVSETL